MGKYKIKLRDTLQEGRYVKEQENQPPLLQTREELIDFLIRNKAYPYCSKTGKIFFRRLKKAEDENTDFEGIIKNGAVEKLDLQTEEDCTILRERFKEELSKKREYKPTIKDWPEEERPREMLMKHGAENLSPAKLLAIILQTGDGVKRISAEDLARNLMDSFGNFRNLDSASFSELCSVEGIGMAKAAQIKAALEIGKRFLREKTKIGKKIKSVDDVVNYYKPYLRDLKKEVFKVMLLDGRNKIIGDITISEGSLTASVVHPREVIKEAIRESAAAVIFVHNHPSGEPKPSEEDIEITNRLVQACDLVGIRVLDHVIIGGDGYMSFVDAGLMKEE
jgi:DNA repair protein RadC